MACRNRSTTVLFVARLLAYGSLAGLSLIMFYTLTIVAIQGYVVVVAPFGEAHLELGMLALLIVLGIGLFAYEVVKDYRGT